MFTAFINQKQADVVCFSDRGEEANGLAILLILYGGVSNTAVYVLHSYGTPDTVLLVVRHAEFKLAELKEKVGPF